MNSRKQEYLDYIKQHRRNVRKCWVEMLRPQLEKHDDITAETLKRVDNLIEHHDESKYSIFEFEPYCNHFYPDKEVSHSTQARWDREFDEAWLHHQHVNPHHWQYWVLRNDTEGVAILDMPFEYIMEMLCDWNSFSANEPESIARKWYDEHSYEMMLSDDTREIVEEFIDYLTPISPWKENEDE